MGIESLSKEKLQEWFTRFGTMKRGQAYEVGVTGKRNPELFIAMGKHFIDCGNEDYEFSNDYKYFKRILNF